MGIVVMALNVLKLVLIGKKNPNMKNGRKPILGFRPFSYCTETTNVTVPLNFDLSTNF